MGAGLFGWDAGEVEAGEADAVVVGMDAVDACVVGASEVDVVVDTETGGAGEGAQMTGTDD